MASEIKANKISPATGTAFTLGDSGDTFSIPSGVTISGFGVSNIVTAVSRATDQTVTKNAITKFEFNVEDADPEGWFDSSTNYRFQPDQSGNYLVMVSLFSSNAASSGDHITGYIYKNGSEVFSNEFDKANYDFNNTNVFFSWVSLNGSSDYIEIYARWGANGTLTFRGESFNGAVHKNNRAIFCEDVMITSDGLEKLGFTLNVDFVLQNDGDGVFIKEWNSASPQPTEAEIETAHAEWQAEYDSQAYSRARAEAYPSWQEQMDMMYHDQTEGSRTWLDAVEAVKEAYPK